MLNFFHLKTVTLFMNNVFYVFMVKNIFNKVMMILDDGFLLVYFNIYNFQNKEAGASEFWEPLKYIVQPKWYFLFWKYIRMPGEFKQLIPSLHPKSFPSVSLQLVLYISIIL